MNLNECRKAIDEIDENLLKLFLERMEVVESVLDYKIKNDIPILNAQREKEVIADKLDKSPDCLKGNVQAFFQNLMENSRTYQHMLMDKPYSFNYEESDVDTSAKTACQGSAGAYSHIIARTMFRDENIVFYKTFSDVFKAVNSGEVSYGVIPIENSTAGGVFEVYDLLKEYDLYINALKMLKVEHNIVSKNASDMSQIKAIYSHNQAIMQCSEFLKKFPQIEAVEDINTALAAKRVSESEDNIAAISSAQAAEIYGLNIIESGVQNHHENYTKFIVVSKKLLSKSGFGEISICMKTKNEPGELNMLLSKFTLYGINLKKIESRPIMSKDFNVMFYINFAGNLSDENVTHLFSDLCDSYDFIKLLGAYSEPKYE